MDFDVVIVVIVAVVGGVVCSFALSVSLTVVVGMEAGESANGKVTSDGIARLWAYGEVDMAVGSEVALGDGVEESIVFVLVS